MTGLEPARCGFGGRCSAAELHPYEKGIPPATVLLICRGGEIRTRGFLNPNQAGWPSFPTPRLWRYTGQEARSTYLRRYIAIGAVVVRCGTCGLVYGITDADASLFDVSRWGADISPLTERHSCETNFDRALSEPR